MWVGRGKRRSVLSRPVDVLTIRVRTPAEKSPPAMSTRRPTMSLSQPKKGEVTAVAKVKEPTSRPLLRPTFRPPKESRTQVTA